MKRTVILLLAAVLLCSCSGKDSGKDALSFVRMPMTVEAAISCEAGDGKVIMRFIDSERYSVCYTEPAIMCGVTYERDGEQSYLCFGFSRVPVTDGEACMGTLAVARFFLLDYSMLRADTQDTADGQAARICKYADDALSCAVYYDESGTPFKLEGSSQDFRAVFTDLVFTYE